MDYFEYNDSKTRKEEKPRFSRRAHVINTELRRDPKNELDANRELRDTILFIASARIY